MVYFEADCKAMIKLEKYLLVGSSSTIILNESGIYKTNTLKIYLNAVCLVVFQHLKQVRIINIIYFMMPIIITCTQPNHKRYHPKFLAC